MIALICFVLAVLASPFESNIRLEAENAVLRHQLIVLRRKLKGRARLTNNDRWFFVQSAPDATLHRGELGRATWLPRLGVRTASVAEPGLQDADPMPEQHRC
jgi:hypothetical protein